MSRGAEVPRRALLIPTAWAVQCPACEAEVEVPNVREDDGGAIHADGVDQFPHCEACGAFIEVVAVSVQEAYPT